MAKPLKDKDQLFREYHTYLRLERGYSENTIEGYEMDLDKLRTYGEEHEMDIVHMTFDQLQDFIFDAFKDVKSEATQARVLAGVHAWFRFLLYKDYIAQDPSELLEGPRKSKHLPTVLTLDEVNRMMAAIDLSSNEGHRNRAMMEMLYGSGLRVSELVNLQLSKIYLSDHYMLIEGKGSKQRLVPISPVVPHGRSSPNRAISLSLTGTVGRSRELWSLRSYGGYAQRQVLPKPSRRTPYAIRLLPICCRTERICVSSSNSLVMKIWLPPRFIRIWTYRICAKPSCNAIRRTN